MTRTWLSVATAVGLVLLATATFLGRWLLAGGDGEGAWRVTLTAEGQLDGSDVSLTMALPLDFRRQHVFHERFKSRDLLHRVDKRGISSRREAVWRRAQSGGPLAFRLSYSFRCDANRRPTPGMKRITTVIDGAPADGAFVKPSPLIESDHKDVFREARALVSEDMPPVDQVEAFFHYVDAFANQATPGPVGARECLQAGVGTSAAKSRLLVALCRNRGIPARLVNGVILGAAPDQQLHWWAEAWVNSHWLPMCPTFHHFGTRTFPKSYFIYQIGEEGPFHRQRGPNYRFTVEELRRPVAGDGDDSLSPARAFFRMLSFASLRPAEQHLVQFLLLLPLSALIVSVYRTLIGVPTFGTFGPALLGLAFLDLKALPWGLAIFVTTVLVGWGMRHVLDRYHLLLVPRTSILLTLIVTFLIVVIVVASRQGVAATHFIGLFPLVILTHLVERFWTVEAEDGTAASFKTLLGTLLVAVTISLALSPEEVKNWMFHYPETIGVVLAAQFLIGRYTGYRLTELYRFQDLLHEEVPGGIP
jgi:transglutaminase-like putative cysteine protease